jgi:hypothetical protein
LRYEARVQTGNVAPAPLESPALDVMTGAAAVAAASPLRVAYLINQYLKISHSFVCRKKMKLSVLFSGTSPDSGVVS